jgi:hypothetical protein
MDWVTAMMISAKNLRYTIKHLLLQEKVEYRQTESLSQFSPIGWLVALLTGDTVKDKEGNDVEIIVPDKVDVSQIYDESVKDLDGKGYSSNTRKLFPAFWEEITRASPTVSNVDNAFKNDYNRWHASFKSAESVSPTGMLSTLLSDLTLLLAPIGLTMSQVDVDKMVKHYEVQGLKPDEVSRKMQDFLDKIKSDVLSLLTGTFGIIKMPLTGIGGDIEGAVSDGLLSEIPEYEDFKRRYN